MARVFPLEITAADVAAMMAALDAKPPYTDDEWATACFDFEAPDVTICVALPNRTYDAAARRTFEEAITLLPRFHVRVATRSSNRADDGRDDIDLSMMEVEGDDVSLLYCARVNATPDFHFSKACHGGPLRPVTFAPEWRTDTAVVLARQMAESRDYGAMPILADALQDAGCDNEDVLNHCRDPHQVHDIECWGCWVVDAVLGRK